MAQSKDVRLVTEAKLDVSNAGLKAGVAADLAPIKNDVADLKTVAGLAPGDVNDATAANLIETKGTLTETALSAAIGEELGTFGTSARNAANDLLTTGGTVFATEYGVKPDGITDNSTALNNLVAQVSASGGGLIQLPRGRIKHDLHILARSNVFIRGAGRGRTILVPTATGFLFSSGEGATQVNTLNNFHLHDLTIDGIDQATANKGVALQFLVNCSFVRLLIKRTQMTGLGIDFLKNVVVDDVTTEDTGLFNDGTMPGGNGIGIGIGGFSDQEESAVVINSHAYRAKRSGIMFEKSGLGSAKGYRCISSYAHGNGDVGIHDCGAAGMVIMGCVSNQNVKDGFASSEATLIESGPGYNGTMIGNYAFKNGRDGFRLDNTMTTPMVNDGYLFASNTAVSNSGRGFHALINNVDANGIVFEGNQSYRNILDGLVINRMSGGTGKYKNLRVVDNLLKGNGQSGTTVNNNVRIAAPIDGGRIEGNDGYSIVIGAKNVPSLGIAFTSGMAHNNLLVDGNAHYGADTDWAVGGTYAGRSKVRNNIGYNDVVGMETLASIGASPSVITAGHRPETIHVFDGTVSAVKKGGVTVRSTTGCSIDLAGGESIEVTWSLRPVIVRELR